MTITEFLSEIGRRSSAYEAADKLFLDRLAPRFSPFEFFKIDELRLSAVLAWLLNPKGSHGQRERFLYLFLTMVGAAWPASICKQATIKTESATDDGRFDIFIQSGNRACVIENKPFALDQKQQIARYLEKLDELARRERALAASDFPLIYLTPSGSPPSTHSLSDDHQASRVRMGQLHFWSYQNHLLRWLRQCRAECRADRVSVFINEFERLIQRLFGEGSETTMMQHLVSDIVSDPEKVASAMEVCIAGNTIRNSLATKFYENLSQVCQKEGWRIADYDFSPAKYAGFSIDILATSPCLFRVQFEMSSYNQVIYGLAKKNENEHGDESIRQRVLAEVGAGRGSVTEAWLWYHSASTTDQLLPFEPHWGSSIEPWVAMSTGKMAELVGAAAHRFLGALTATA